jgi:hypothetical protein
MSAESLVCPKCNQEVPSLFEGICLSCHYAGVGTNHRECSHCGITKPEDSFLQGVNVCQVCRKAIKYKFRMKYASPISKFALYGTDLITCRSCFTLVPLERVPKFSYECPSCWTKRHLTELANLKPLKVDLKCRVCGNSNEAASYSLGRLTCISCIRREASKGGKS